MLIGDPVMTSMDEDRSRNDYIAELKNRYAVFKKQVGEKRAYQWWLGEKMSYSPEIKTSLSADLKVYILRMYEEAEKEIFPQAGKQLTSMPSRPRWNPPK